MSDLRPHTWTSHSKCHGNNVSYAQALRNLAQVAVKQRDLMDQVPKGHDTKPFREASHSQSCDRNVEERDTESISVLTASGRMCAHDVVSPRSTPMNDTSAMDGFAVTSALTIDASADSPVKFHVAGIIAAGADIYNDRSLGINSRSVPMGDDACVEIMTGACFPERQFPQLDAVVKVEDVELVEDRAPDGDPVVKYILVSAPVKPRQHRRPAGSDFLPGDLIIAKDTIVEPKHVMALTSVGIDAMRVTVGPVSETRSNGLRVHRKISIGVLSTGSELLNLFDPVSRVMEEDDRRQRFPDSNGPYITSALRSTSSCFSVDYLGPCLDDEQSLFKALSNAVDARQYDVLVTSGGVSVGRFDLVRKVLESRFDAEIIFHGCLVRPGAPVLFGLLHRRHDGLSQTPDSMTAFLGAPGNPIAAAMTVRFFLQPFLSMLQAPRSLSVDDLVQMALSETLPVQIRMLGHDRERKKPVRAVAFFLAKHSELEDLLGRVDLLSDQASYKIKPFVQANCWVTAPAGKDKISDGDQTQCYSLW